jgi:hypothetical protein
MVVVVVLELGDRLRVPLMAAVLERPPSALLSRFLGAAGSEAEA